MKSVVSLFILLFVFAVHANPKCVVNIIPGLINNDTKSVSSLTKAFNKKGFSVRVFASSDEQLVKANIYPGDFYVAMGSGVQENSKCNYEYNVMVLRDGKTGSNGASLWSILGSSSVRYGRVSGKNCVKEMANDISKAPTDSLFCNIEGYATRKQDNGCLAEIPKAADETGQVFAPTGFVKCDVNRDVSNSEAK